MANNPKHMENLIGKGFESRPENINRKGRPKKIYKVLREKGYTMFDIRAAFGEIAWYDMDETTELADDETKPMIMRVVAGQFLKAKKDADWNKVREILEHVIGKPRQTIDTNIGTQKADLDNIFPTEEELGDDDIEVIDTDQHDHIDGNHQK